MRPKTHRHVTAEHTNEVYAALLECAKQAYGRGNLANVARLTEAVMADVAADYLADKAGEESTCTMRGTDTGVVQEVRNQGA